MTRKTGGLKLLAAVAAAMVTAAVTAALTPVPANAHWLVRADKIVFTEVSSPNVVVPVSPGAPAIFAATDEDLRATGQFRTNAGLVRPASYFFPVTVDLYSVSATGAVTKLASQKVAASATSATFNGIRLPAGNGWKLRMRAYNGYDVAFPGITGDSPTFNVQDESATYPANSNPSPIGGAGAQTANTPCVVSLAEPVCGDLILSNASGVQSNQIGSVGDCQANECLTDEYLQALVKLNPTVYNRSFPMKILVKCHPSVCDALAGGDKHNHTGGGGHNGGSPGNGHGGGVTNITLIATTLADGALVTSAPCATSGKVGSTQPFCTDYAVSFRASNGVWNIVWLSPGDARVSFPK